MLQRLFIFLLILLILPDIYLYLKFIVGLTAKRWLRTLYWMPTLLLAVGLIYLVYFGHSLFAGHTLSVGWFAIFFFVFASPKLVLALCSLIGLPFQKWLHWRQTPFVTVGLILAVVNAFIILYGSFVGRTKFDVKEVSYTSPRVPAAFDGYRIVQLSDMHIGSFEGESQAVQQLVDKVNAQHPDLILFTGDLVNHHAGELDEFQDILSQLHARDGVYSVLGNHDYGTYYDWKSQQDQDNNLIDLKRREAAMGWTLLNNAHVILKQGTDSIALIGVENGGDRRFSQHSDLTKAKNGIADSTFQLLMSHNPAHWRNEVLPQSNIDLMLAGHTHAMQLQVGQHSMASYIYPEWGGMYPEGQRGLYVNVGIGYVGLPFRFGAWPEITVLTLQR